MNHPARAWSWLNRLLERRAVILSLLVALGLLYAWAYARDGLNPGTTPLSSRVGWWSWTDQYRYALAAEQLANGTITAEAYHYPLGYSALGALGGKVLPHAPFFLGNLLCVLATVVVWWKLARRWLSPALTVLVAGAYIWAHADLLRLTTVIPWNTIPTQLTLLTGIWIITAKIGPSSVLSLAGLAAITWLIRPAEAACFAPMLIWSVLRLPSGRERWRYGAIGAVLIGLAIVSVGLLNLRIFDSWTTPYDHQSAGIGFFGYSLLPKLFWLLIDGRPFFGDGDTAMLVRFPWLLLSLPGLAFWIRREGLNGAAAIATMALNGFLYLAYNDLFPSSVIRFSLIHYFIWLTLPLLACSAAAVCLARATRRMWLVWPATFAIGLLVVGLDYQPTRLPAPTGTGEILALPTDRPLWVHFASAPIDEASQLTLDGSPLREPHDYQIPYVPTDLSMLLGLNAQGNLLQASGDHASQIPPDVGTFRWTWRWGARWTESPPR